MATCDRPGCAGEIELGYCNLCGHLAEAEGEQAASELSEGVALAGEGTAPGSGRTEPLACARPGCGGTVGADGFCDQCGHAPSDESQRVSAEPGSPAGVSAKSDSAGSQGTSTIRRIPSSTLTTSGSGGAGSGGSRRSLAAGLVEMPSVPERDPQSVVLADPEVPERKRRCAHCDHEVGRRRGARPARTEGFCPHCGKAYSFTPKLWPGDLVKNQYLVSGCIAHGGLGWIYLAQDRSVENRWVVLKGLLDSGDESALAAAIAERRFLAQVDHPNIVHIHNFVEHDDFGYIVMEYVGGESLREIRTRYRQEEGGPLPVAQAIAYILDIFPAIDYLHRRGLLFCDFKPDNVIQTPERIKLIDLGAVRRVDDPDPNLYSTVGYQAPEFAESGGTITSDLYTVARTLLTLAVDVAGFHDEKRNAVRLPPREDVAVFQRYESFHRFLQKATDTDPDMRFQSAPEMEEQLIGVLRQVVATDGGSPPPRLSTLFSAELGASADASPWQFLPVPAVDPSDPASGALATLALVGADQRQSLLETISRSPELSLYVARTAIDDGDFELATRELDSKEARNSVWRVAWWRGVLLLAEGKPSDALSFFAAVATELPGELAPKLAMAVCSEQAADEEDPSAPGGERSPESVAQQLRYAARYYGLVSATDSGYASASFGLARVAMRLGDREEAVSSLERIPKSSSAYVTAQITLCRVQCAPVQGELPQLSDLVATSSVLDGLALETSVRLPLVRGLHEQALAMLLDGRVPSDDSVKLMGTALDEFDQRAALDRAFRALAKIASSDEERFALVDQANAYRPRTMT